MTHLLGMPNRTSHAIGAAFTISLVLSLPLLGCSRPTSQPRTPATLGVPRSTSELEAAIREPGPVTVETVVGAEWAVPRSGVLNLSHPKAVAAGLQDGDEPIVIEFHAIEHPTRGLFLVDTGVEHALRENIEGATFGGLVASEMHFEKMKIRTDTASWIRAHNKPVAGVFLTHVHLDHVSGMRDVPNDAAVYVGRGEGGDRELLNLFIAPSLDAELAGKGPLREWQWTPDPDGGFDAVLDVFGDNTVFAIDVPGHTSGSTAYLARTPNGPVLMVGDACHTRWGWQNGVEPGTFSHDKPRSAVSLQRLRGFVAKHPEIDVRLGHQAMGEPASERTARAH
jgi:glyoxylase-like metal-dependent hydrolase (beta-lactamase superfamily II)